MKMVVMALFVLIGGVFVTILVDMLCDVYQNRRRDD